jgi:hypothetical protein
MLLNKAPKHCVFFRKELFPFVLRGVFHLMNENPKDDEGAKLSSRIFERPTSVPRSSNSTIRKLLNRWICLQDASFLLRNYKIFYEDMPFSIQFSGSNTDEQARIIAGSQIF